MDMQTQQNVEIKTKTSFVSNDALFDETSRYTLSDLHPLTRLTQKMSQSLKIADQQYTIELATEKDKPEILRLLKKFFFKDEPLNNYIRLGDECKDLEVFSLKCLPESCSFKAVNNKGEIIGIFLNGLLRKQPPKKDESETKEDEKITHPKFKKIISLMDYIDSKFNIFDLYPNYDTVLDGKILSVNSDYRGMGIAGRLTEKSLELMRERSIPLMHVLCTSQYSARVLEKLDFTEVFNMPYNEYKVDGEIVFRPEPPHTAARILIKEL